MDLGHLTCFSLILGPERFHLGVSEDEGRDQRLIGITLPRTGTHVIISQGDTLLIIREMQIKTTMRSVRMVNINKSIKIMNAGEDIKKREPFYSVGGNVNWCSYYGKQYVRVCAQSLSCV